MMNQSAPLIYLEARMPHQEASVTTSESTMEEVKTERSLITLPNVTRPLLDLTRMRETQVLLMKVTTPLYKSNPE